MKKNMPIDIMSSSERAILDLRKIGCKDVLILGKYRYTEARGQLAEHRHHSMLEICYCAKGEQTYEVGGKVYRIRGGEIFVTYPGEWHGTGGFPEEKGELYWLIIRMDRNEIQGRRGKDDVFLRWEGAQAKAWHQVLLGLPRHFAAGAGIQRCLDEVFRIFPQAGDPFVLVRVQHLLADYLLQVVDASRLAAGAKPIEERTKSTRLEAIDVFLAKNLEEPVVLRELALAAGLSLSRFKAWFKAETGSTPLDYALRYKIGVAQRRLEQGRLSVARIATATGFQNAQYFATVFRRFTGMSPSEYRKNLPEKKG